MTSPIQPNKTYGVLHTESFFSFLGFAKKIGSSEIQKIDVYLDDKLIDTIEANKFIEKIDDMYDVENQAFSYNLPIEYIGKKATISFKNHDSQDELLNSPYTLIDKNHEKFSEAKFIHSLNQPLNEELKNMYKPNSIGFLATKENLEDVEFVEYINKLIKRFPDVEFYGFFFDRDIKIFNIKNRINYKLLDNINNLISEVEVFIWDLKSKLDLNVTQYLIKYNKNIFNLFNYKNTYFIDLEDKTLRDFDVWFLNKNETIIENPIKFGFSNDEIKESNKSYHKFMYEILLNRYSKENYILDLEQNALEFLQFVQLELIFMNRKFKEAFIKIHYIRNFT